MNTVVLSLLFLRKDDSVLLAMKKRGFGAGRWNGVGGKIEPGETIEAAMIRETEEEIGVTPTVFEKAADIVFDEYFKGEPTFMNVHVFTCTEWEGEPTETEEMAPKWFSKDDLPFNDMWPDDPYWLPQVMAGQQLDAHFKLDKHDAIISHTINVH